ncbi:hypothetical protein CSUI_010483 [Cystoisospora suis]|uniref:SRS domain-containing protein n=1 Tax=Cystoisospora suis TaxID=483139 RepID=A0A2C6KGN2_9APIC|nr:hypothetical protein CSUI_010483 [Cystoisospora suis]
MDRRFLIACIAVAFALPTACVVAENSKPTPVLKGVTGAGRFERTKNGAVEAASDSAGPVGVQPRRLSAGVVTQCRPLQGGQKARAVLYSYLLDAQFSCGIGTGSTVELQPDPTTARGKCCDAAGTNCTLNISDVVGVTGSTSQDKEVVTLKLDDVPTNLKGQLHFKCVTKGTESEYCIVTVDMPAPFEENQCSFDRNVKLTPIEGPNTETAFDCRGPVTSVPTDAQVFTGDDCTGNPSKLKDLIPGATLEKESNIFRLRVAALPTTAQNLCFKCIYRDPRTNAPAPTATCKVTVAVAGTSKTTTASTTSAAEGITVKSFAAVAFAFFSSAALHS